MLTLMQLLSLITLHSSSYAAYRALLVVSVWGGRQCTAVTVKATCECKLLWHLQACSASATVVTFSKHDSSAAVHEHEAQARLSHPPLFQIRKQSFVFELPAQPIHHGSQWHAETAC